MLAFLIGGRLVYGLANWGQWENWWQGIVFWRYPGMVYGGSILAMTWWTLFIAENKKWKFWQLMEETIIYLIFLVMGMMAADFLFGGMEVTILAFMGLMLITAVMGELFMNRYRSLWWYPSGKRGFVVLFDGLWLGWGGMVLARVFEMSLVWQITLGLLGLTSLVGLIILGDSYKVLLNGLGRKKNG